MYKVETTKGKIIFPDGFTLLPPYDSPRYLEYAEYVSAGNSPEMYSDPQEEVPQSVQRFQARAALFQIGLLETVENIMQNPATPILAKLAWQDAQEFYRDSETVKQLAAILSLSENDVNNLFINAAKIRA